jgi:orotate phosphoribosyltransferase
MAGRKLLDLLVTHSYQHSDTPSFRLASGKFSNFYIDCKMTTMRGEAMPLVGEAVFQLLPSEVQAVGGLTMGADPIANAVAYFSQSTRPRVDMFSVRKEAKQHGLRKWIEGCAKAGSRVAVVDDVVTTGGSTIDAIQKCREEELQIVAVVVLVDRQEDGGIEKIRRAVGPNVPVCAVFTRAHLEARWHETHADTPAPAHQAVAG